MDTAPQLPRSRTAAGEGRVSILVVMDTAPQLQKIASTAHASSMFQSLLLWIPLLNEYQTLNLPVAQQVSILVVMDTAPQHLLCDDPTLRQLRFQSLLLWIPLLNGKAGPVCRYRCSRFNPCCYGYRSSTSNGIVAGTRPGVFQSLLLWIPLLN